jgi:hypothetical protein
MKLQVTTIDAKPSATPWFVHQDVKRLNDQWGPTYTPKQRTEAQKALDLLHTAYHYKGAYINYRKNFIAIKIDRPIKRNKLYAVTADSYFADKGYSKVVSPQGFVIRIPR